ncbi:biotin--[acetyl-CoA-carboxylase] ligase [Sphingomonas sp. NPDC079357]|uniref:biotin--[acetyl-CoA-carboxylase] ligase n=1 Tax=Sphingomonas sp. NPDC079357 TaxID=3364518 RepID=UPI00385157CE
MSPSLRCRPGRSLPPTASSEAAALPRILTVPATGSTNADLLALADDRAVDEGTWLRAEQQTAGRGRQGRVWDSPAGNLYASTLVAIRPGDPPAAGLALVAAVALEEAVHRVLPDASALTLKWPNDLLLAGAKLSGILLERGASYVVVGIGVNVAHHPALADRATTSLRAAGATVDAATLLADLADRFAAWLLVWRDAGMAPVAARWSDRAHPVGTALMVRLPDQTVLDGQFRGLDASGALLLGLADGTRHVIHAGDVFVV